MAPSAQAHKRAHSLLLFEKLLNLRDSASPLTLVLDTVGSGATLRVEVAPGRFVERPVASPGEIVPTGEALLAVPEGMAADGPAQVEPPRESGMRDPADRQGFYPRHLCSGACIASSSAYWHICGLHFGTMFTVLAW